MKYIFEPGEPFQMLALSQQEVNLLKDILKGKVRKDISSKHEKYKDIHESGEATERQCDLMFKYEEQLNFIDGIISLGD